MKALSVRQPWAWLICAGYKDIENRNWHSEFRGRIYVHAAQKFANEAPEWLSNKGFDIKVDAAKISLRGAIIGEVDIVDCVSESKSEWFTGKYGFVLANPVIYENPVPCKGRLGFFEPDIVKK